MCLQHQSDVNQAKEIYDYYYGHSTRFEYIYIPLDKSVFPSANEYFLILLLSCSSIVLQVFGVSTHVLK